MKTAYLIKTAEKVSLLKDCGERQRILHDSGEVETEDKTELAQQVELCNAQDDPEKALRDMYTAQGVPKEKQDAIFAEITAKAKPEYMEKFFGFPTTEQDRFDIAQDAREREQMAPDLENLPIFGIEMNASEQINLFAGA
jgi:hypothetical protein